MKTIEYLYSEYLKSSGVTTDSRTAGSNMIFFALKGENYNGNIFAKKALKKGCRLAVTDDPEIGKNDRIVFVEDSLKCLQELANYHRSKLSIPIIAITGSNGKTTTRELMHHVLYKKYKTLATQGNLNNHIGVPLTLLRIRDEEIAIIEMGANHPGEIDFLCHIADPDYGIITNIGKAHLEGFGSLEGVKRTKSELYRYLDRKNGIIFINGSNPVLQEVSELENIGKVFYIDGKDPQCDGFIVESKEDLKVGIKFIPQERILEARLNITGAYNLENILAAACIGYYFKIPPEDIIAGLQSYESKNNRSQYINTDRNRVIMDAYNANPTSMMESIRNFLSLNGSGKILILGDMLELGPYSMNEHESLLLNIEKKNIEQVYLVGREFGLFKDKFDFSFFETSEDLCEHFRKFPVKDGLLLLKGSRGIGLEKILEVL
jgi:UDP-N-acetylmuramoyl-tripeptide--D-alanyl-D-alanine ligase